MNRDPYSVLGISSSATEDEIKSAYRKLAKKYHPDLNPGDKAAEERMKEVNEAYAQAMQIKKGGGTQSSHGGNPYGNGYSSGYGSYYGQNGRSGYGGSYGQYSASGGYGSSGDGSDQGSGFYWQGNPFGGFDPFETMFNGSRRSTFRTRNYQNPELKTAESYVLARQFHDALNLLNRILVHDADWHALYARADFGLGNRISALEHARTAAQMAPSDQDYQMLLREVQSGRQQYQQTRRNGYDFRSTICSNPFLSCCALNILLNCCLGGRMGFCC